MTLGTRVRAPALSFRATALLALAIGFATMLPNAAQAAPITGVGWIVSDAVAQEASLANAVAQISNPNRVDFTVNALTFSSYGNAANTGDPAAAFTISSFLNSQGALMGTPVYSGTATADTVLNENGGGMLFVFLGVETFVNGQTFSLTHDDGIEFYVGCDSPACTPAELVLSQPGPTAPVTTDFTYTGPSGTFPFLFIYGECCTAPAVFQTSLVRSQVPAPSSVMLVVLAIVGTSSLLRRKRKF